MWKGLSRLSAGRWARPATEFTAFCRVLDQIPDAEDLDGKTTAVPYSPDMIYACIGALINNLSHNPTPVRMSNFFAFISRLMMEYQVLAINDAVKPASGMSW